MNLKKLLLLLLILALVIFSYFMLRSIEEPSAEIGKALEETEVIEIPRYSTWRDVMAVGDINDVRALLDSGADINERFNFVWVDDEYKNITPLMAAALKGNKEMARLLLERGADPRLTVVRNGQEQTAADLSWGQRHGPANGQKYVDLTLELERAGALRRQAGND